MDCCEAYLSLLGEISGTLERLTETAHEKEAAIRQDDLAALDEVIKKEQALALALRGFEQKRAHLLTALGLEASSLTDLAGRCPQAFRLRAKAAAEDLRRQYQLYCGAAGAVRTLLEVNLHQIGQYLGEEGGPTAVSGYAPQSPAVEPPPPMKTDFRA